MSLIFLLFLPSDCLDLSDTAQSTSFFDVLETSAFSAEFIACSGALLLLWGVAKKTKIIAIFPAVTELTFRWER